MSERICGLYWPIHVSLTIGDIMKRMNNTKKKALVGECFEILIDTEDERGKEIPKGTMLRIVAVAPKVCYTPKNRIELYPEQYDSCAYFYNAVVVDQTDQTEPDYANRIREHFVTIGIK